MWWWNKQKLYKRKKRHIEGKDTLKISLWVKIKSMFHPPLLWELIAQTVKVLLFHSTIEQSEVIKTTVKALKAILAYLALRSTYLALDSFYLLQKKIKDWNSEKCYICPATSLLLPRNQSWVSRSLHTFSGQSCQKMQSCLYLTLFQELSSGAGVCRVHSEL